MNPRLSIALIGALALPAAALAEVQIAEATYDCARGVTLSVSYINADGDPGIAVMSVDGKLITLRARPTGSGVRYIALDEQDSYRLYTKGDAAFVRWMAADHTAEEIAVLDDCRAR
jgi:membrane-bound inhibitor of C-type lysozyme